MRQVAQTLLRLPPAEHSVGRLGSRRQLDGDHLRLQEGAEVQLPQELPLHAVVGGELDNYTWDLEEKKEEDFKARCTYKKSFWTVVEIEL